MTTSNSATDTSLPTLTPIECDAAIASIEPAAPPLLQLAAQLKLSPHELLEILARPHVAAFAQAARAFANVRADILACYNHTSALQELAEIARNRDNDVNTRLHAAIAVLRDFRAGPPAPALSRPARLPHTPPASPPRFHLPAPKPPALPAPEVSPTSRPPPTPAVPTHERRPAPTRAPVQPDAAAATPIAIHRAAGAPLASRAHRAADIEPTCAPRAASPADAGRPP